MAITAVGDMPEMPEGVAGTVYPYATVGPQSKETVVRELFATTDPLIWADELAIFEAASVVTDGGIRGVVKVRSLPLVVPMILVPLARK